VNKTLEIEGLGIIYFPKFIPNITETPYQMTKKIRSSDNLFPSKC
jgi:hypothetical protein